MNNYFLKKSGFNPCEDSLTSIVLDSLKYLPDILFWKILNQSLIGCNKFPSNLCIDSIEFWPRWSLSEGGNSRVVEPDVFIRTESIDIIVEAKRYNTNQQRSSQKKRQIAAYYQEFSEDFAEKKLYYLLLGGLHDKDDVLDNQSIGHTVCQTDWINILHVVENMMAESKENHIKRLLQDVLDGLAKHRLTSFTPLADLNKGYKINYPLSQVFLNDI